MKRDNKYRTLLMLDEFPALGKLDIMQRGLAFIVGYGLKAYLITQDLTQLYTAYGKDEQITSNCHIQIAYPPNRPETAKYISDMTGKTTIVKDQISQSGKRTGLFQNNVTVTKQEHARNLLEVDEILRLQPPEKDAKGNIVKPGHMLIFCAGLPVIYGEQILYFKDAAFSARSKIPAPATTDSLPAATTEDTAKPVEAPSKIMQAHYEISPSNPPSPEIVNEAYADLINWQPDEPAEAQTNPEKTEQNTQKDTSWKPQQKEQLPQEVQDQAWTAQPDEPTEGKGGDSLDGQEFV